MSIATSAIEKSMAGRTDGSGAAQRQGEGDEGFWLAQQDSHGESIGPALIFGTRL